MDEIVRSVAAAGLWVLVFGLITLHVGRLLGLRRSGAVLAGYAVFCTFQILLVRVLDLLGFLTAAGALAGYVLTAALGLIVYLRRRDVRSDAAREGPPTDEVDADLRLVRRIALGSAAAVLVGAGIFTLVSPVHVWDVLAYHMPMVASYVQNASLDPWPTQDLRQVYRVNGGELQLLNIALLSASDAWVELSSVLALGVVLVASFALARLVLHHRALPYVVLTLVLTAPQIAVSATTAKNDLVFTAVLLSAFYWAISAAVGPAPRAAAHGALAAFSAGLAAATKVMGLNILGAAGLLLLVWAVLRRVPYRVVVFFVLAAVLTVVVLAGPVYWSNLSHSATPVGVAPNEVTFTTGPANLVAAARYYVYDLAFKRLVVLQMFEHDLSHYGYFFPFLLALGLAGATRQVVNPRVRRAAVAGLALMAAALFISVIAVRLPIRYDQRFMVWLLPVVAILAATLAERLDGRHVLVLTSAAASFALFNLFLTLSNEADGLFTRSAAHLAGTGSLARYADVPSRHYMNMIEGYDVLAAAAASDSVLYVGSDDSWMYPAWGPRFSRHVRGVFDDADALEQVTAGPYRFIVIERTAAPDLQEATAAVARGHGYRTIFDGKTRLILERV